MGTNARVAAGTLTLSGAMLFIGPASIAVADPSVDQVTNSMSNEDVRHSGPVSLGQLRPAVTPPELNLSTFEDMSQMESLRLQMRMDRLSKLQSTLSNIMKKVSDNAGSLVGNIR